MRRAEDRSDAVHLLESDPTWPQQFDAEVDVLRKLLANIAASLRFEHVGSTAVPGLIAKPIIDILIIPPAGVWPDHAFRTALPSAGYVFWDGNPDPQHLFFVKGMPPFGTGRTHHVHVRPLAASIPILSFRDSLRRNSDRAKAYAELKIRLADEFPFDREAYTRGKTPFIEDALTAIHPPGDQI